MMLRDMVPRLDSARMSAMFSEVVATADDGGEFLSPRTELTIEDVRRLRRELRGVFVLNQSVQDVVLLWKKGIVS